MKLCYILSLLTFLRLCASATNFTLPPLPYGYDALSASIDKQVEPLTTPCAPIFVPFLPPSYAVFF